MTPGAAPVAAAAAGAGAAAVVLAPVAAPAPPVAVVLPPREPTEAEEAEVGRDLRFSASNHRHR